MSANDQPPRAMDAEEDTFPARMNYAGMAMLRRDRVEETIRNLAPYGRSYLFHCLGVHPDDFMAACRHFGLDHLVVDVLPEEIDDEMRARRERGAPSTDRPIPVGHASASREYADAMLDVYERKVAEDIVGKADAAARGPALRARPRRACPARRPWPRKKTLATMPAGRTWSAPPPAPGRADRLEPAARPGAAEHEHVRGLGDGHYLAGPARARRHGPRHARERGAGPAGPPGSRARTPQRGRRATWP